MAVEVTQGGATAAQRKGSAGEQWVYMAEDAPANNRDLLGGKGAGLAAMTEIHFLIGIDVEGSRLLLMEGTQPHVAASGFTEPRVARSVATLFGSSRSRTSELSPG